MQKVKISSVSYLNSLPFIYGFENSSFLNGNIILSKDYPSICSSKLLSGEVDLGLIPAAEILKLKNPEIISDYCIGAVGKVKTVLLLSHVPLNEIKTVLLDYQSKTSINLVQILAKDFWRITPNFVNANAGFENNIIENTAGVVIGDRTFDIVNNFEFVYDLAEEWKNFTDLPFVFAAWTANKKLNKDFIDNFNNSCRFGLENIDIIVKEYQKQTGKNTLFLKEYLTKDISYTFDEEKRKGMKLFHELLKKHKLNQL